MRIDEAQDLMRRLYGERDRERGLERTFLWFVEEVGELAEALRHKPELREEEFADVQAWLLSLANIAGVDLAAALRRKYDGICPKCTRTPCSCPSA